MAINSIGISKLFLSYCRLRVTKPRSMGSLIWLENHKVMTNGSCLPESGTLLQPDFITPEGKITIEGYCTDLVTDMGVEYIKEGRDKDKPFLLMVQHKAPHRCWMPAPRHLNLYDDIEIPEPATLFDDYKDNALAARYQELEIDRHMDPHYDLFLDLVPTEKPEPIQQRQDRSAWSTCSGLRLSS